MKGWFKRLSINPGWRLVGDLLGGLALFALLWAGLFIGWGMS